MKEYVKSHSDAFQGLNPIVAVQSAGVQPSGAVGGNAAARTGRRWQRRMHPPCLQAIKSACLKTTFISGDGKHV
jgi:hypothetical protein